MEYAILDELLEQNNERKEEYESDPKNTKLYISSLEELTEPFFGSSTAFKTFIFRNYFSKTGIINLLIVIRESNNGKMGEFKLNNVETAIYPLYFPLGNDDGIDLPPLTEEPDILQDQAKFIIEKRSLPKKPFLEEFNPEKHRWQINRIAEHLQISNRKVAQYCKAKQI